MPSDQTDLDALIERYRLAAVEEDGLRQYGNAVTYKPAKEELDAAEAALRARLAPPTHADDEAQADTDLNILDIRALDRRWSRRYSIDTREMRARAETAERALAECRAKTIEECAQEGGYFGGDEVRAAIRALKKEPRT